MGSTSKVLLLLDFLGPFLIGRFIFGIDLQKLPIYFDISCLSVTSFSIIFSF